MFAIFTKFIIFVNKLIKRMFRFIAIYLFLKSNHARWSYGKSLHYFGSSLVCHAVADIVAVFEIVNVVVVFYDVIIT